MKYSLFFMTALSLTSPICAQDGASNNRWEETIARFEAADREHLPEPGQVLFIGSSSIRLWDLKASFPGVDALNRGFGGSEVADSVHFFSRIVKPYRPRQIVMYAGDNDIAKGQSPCQVYEDFRTFVKLVQAHLPGTSVVYVAIKPSLKRWSLVHQMRAANALIKADCEEDALLTFFDIDAPMLGEDGTPRKELFAGDGLHLNTEGYQLWSELLRPLLRHAAP